MENYSRVERRKLETRNRIIETCEQIFVHEKNYNKTTIREIAHRADVSIGSVYLHFKTKEDIVATLLAEFTSKQRKKMETLVSDKTCGAVMLNNLFNYFDELSRDPYVILLSQIPFIHPKDTEIINDAIQKALSSNFTFFGSLVADIFRIGKEDKTINVDADPDLLAFTLIEILLHLIQGSALEKFYPSVKRHFPENYNSNSIFSVFRSFISKGLFISPIPPEGESKKA